LEYARVCKEGREVLGGEGEAEEGRSMRGDIGQYDALELLGQF